MRITHADYSYHKNPVVRLFSNSMQWCICTYRYFHTSLHICIQEQNSFIYPDILIC